MNIPIQTSVLDRTLSFGCFEAKGKTAVQISLIAIAVLAGLTFAAALYGVLPGWTKWVGVSLIPIALTTCAILNCKRTRPSIKKIDLSNDLVTKYPKDVLLQIFKHLNAKDLIPASLCCKQWCFAAGDYNLWESLYSKDHFYIPQFNTFLDLKKACFAPWLGKSDGKLSISIKTINPEIKLSAWTYTDRYFIGVDSNRNVIWWNLFTGKREANAVVFSDKSNAISELYTYKNKLVALFVADKSDTTFEIEPCRQISIIDLTNGKIKTFPVKEKKVYFHRNKLYCLSNDSIKALNIEKETWSFTIQNKIAKNDWRCHVHEEHLITFTPNNGIREIWDLEKGKKIGEFSRFLTDKEERSTVSAYGIYGDKEIILQYTQNKNSVLVTVNNVMFNKSYHRALDIGYIIKNTYLWQNNLIFIGYQGLHFCVKGINLDSGDTVINLYNSNFYSEGSFISSLGHEGKVIFGTDRGTLFVYDLFTGKLQCKTDLVNRSIFQGYTYRNIEKIRAYRNMILAYIDGKIVKYTLQPK